MVDCDITSGLNNKTPNRVEKKYMQHSEFWYYQNMRYFMKRIIPILLIMGLLVACNSDPSSGSSKLPEATLGVKQIVFIGINSALDAIDKYDYYGSYAGMYKSVGSNTVFYHYSNVSDNIDLSFIDPSLGIETVKISGQVSFNYENPPSSYPCNIEYNISFEIMERYHTLEQRKRITGSSSQTVSYLKVDGVQYNPY